MGIYATIQVINLGVNDSLMYFGVDMLHIPHLLAQTGTALVIAVWSFFIFRYLFRSDAIVMSHENS